MKSPQISSTILTLMANNEETIGRLYAAFAVRFDGMKGFWHDLSEEEYLHANWILVLKQMTEAGKLTFEVGENRIDEIRQFTSRIENEIARADITASDLKKALTLALSIEENWIECNYSQYFKTDNPKLKNTLKDLETATRYHADKLRSALDFQNALQ